MIKICHVTSAHTSKDIRIFYKMCTSLAEEGYDVYHVAPGEDRKENGVQVVGIGDKPKNRISRMLLYSRKAYKEALRLNADVYHFHDPELLRYASKFKKKGKIVIFDSHENYVGMIKDKQWIPTILRNAVSKIYEQYQTYIFKKIDSVIFVSPNFTDKYKDKNKSVITISNFPNVSEDSSADTPEDDTIIFTGGISPQWNHEAILKAINEIDNIQYILCGPAESAYLTNLKDKNGWNKVDYRGKIPFLEVTTLLRKSSIGIALLQPSGNTDNHVGTLGNTKIFEYMEAGLPILCTDFILWKEIVSEYNCGICVNPLNVQESIEAINELINNPRRAHQMGLNGRKAILEKYNWGEEKKKLFHLYKFLLKERGNQ